MSSFRTAAPTNARPSLLHGRLQGPGRNITVVPCFGSLNEERCYNVSSTRAELTFGRPCWRPARRPPASSSGQRSCLPAAPPSGCCRFAGCSPGSQTLTNLRSSVPVLLFLGLSPADCSLHLFSCRSFTLTQEKQRGCALCCGCRVRFARNQAVD